jgi:hypothetical protein
LTAVSLIAIEVVRHRSRNETAFPIDLSVVKARLGIITFRVSDELDSLLLEIVEVQAVRERNHCASLLTQRHRADMVRHEKSLDFAAVCPTAIDLRRRTINPVQPLFPHVPKRALAEMIIGIDQ